MGLTIAKGQQAREQRMAKWQAAFVRALRKCPNVRASAKAAGVSAWTAYRARKADSSFAAQWDEALQESVSEVEMRAFEIALQGDPTSSATAKLIEMVLKAHRPAYRDKAEVAVAGGIILLPMKEDKDP
jgi:hypothetical protein